MSIFDDPAKYFQEAAQAAINGIIPPSGQDFAKSLGSGAKALISGNDVRQQSNVVQPNPISAANEGSDNGGAGGGFNISSLGLPIILIGGVAAYFLIKKR